MIKNRSSHIQTLWRLPSSENDIRYLLPASREKNGFESIDAARRENAFRISCLKSYARQCPTAERSEQALDLACRINKRHALMLRCSTFASALSTRQHRRGFCGAVLAALGEATGLEVALFTIVPSRGWRVSRGELFAVDPATLLARLRQQLNRTGLKCEKGWMIAALHGDYTLEADAYQLHIHLLAVGDAITMVETLRLLPNYCRFRSKPDTHSEMKPDGLPI